MNRRDFMRGTAATAIAAAMPATPDVWTNWHLYAKADLSATDRLLYSFRQMKEVVAVNILNDNPLLGQMKWDEAGKQWCWDGERWIDEHQTYMVQDDDEP